MTRACALHQVLIDDGGVTGPHWFQAHDATIFAGYGVQYTDSDEVAVCATNAASVLGVADCPSYHDIEVVFAVGERVPVWFKGSGVELWMTHDGVTGDATLAIPFGTPIARSNSTAGLCELSATDDVLTYGLSTRYILAATGVPQNIRVLL